jgi:NADP-dependent 3-hydroxy acid dehydrogenase YdfG
MANVIVTGASGGFGRLIVKTLIKDSHKVIASMRGVNGKNKSIADELRGNGASVIEMDVTDDHSVQNAIRETVNQVTDIDVVVNNAGVGVLGFQETFTPDDWKKLFDINVFGVQRVNRAVLPGMRKRRSGMLIHISSLLGRIVMPFYGPYNASKFALEAMADNYKIELSGFGIESVLVEPGGYGTTFMDNLMRPSDSAGIQAYGNLAGVPEMTFKYFEKLLVGPNAPDPQWVADAVSSIIKMPRGQRPFRTVVDRLGMGTAIEPYNQAADELQKGMFAAFGMADSLKLKM